MAQLQLFPDSEFLPSKFYISGKENPNGTAGTPAPSSCAMGWVGLLEGGLYYGAVSQARTYYYELS